MNRTRALLATIAALATTVAVLPGALASNPSSGGLTPPAADGSNSVTWTGGPYTGFVNGPEECTDLTCDTYTLNFAAPADYWSSHDGSVSVGIEWGLPSDDFDLYVYDSAGTKIKDSAAAFTNSESVDLGQLPPGAYTVKVVPYQTAGGSYSGTATVSAFDIPTGMKFPEDRSAVEKELVQDYPLNIVFIGRTPSAAEVADLKSRIPTQYRPPVSSKSDNACELTQVGAGYLNWNKC
ncbi:MAG TPA: T9SS type A sorting domain-containing protein, partial [Jatrophihabitans sp.]